MSVYYFCEDIDFKLTDQAILSQWICGVVHSHNFTVAEINYIFCSDDYLLDINRRHLNHDYYTDIITFDNSEEANLIESDIFISVDRVRENATEQSVAFEIELRRVMIHGILHLLGYKDKSQSDQKVMREKEDACLSLLQN